MKNLELLLNPLHLEDLQNEEHPSIFNNTDGYQLLILRLYKLKNEELNVSSSPFVILENQIYYYYKHDGIKKFSDNYTALYKFIDERVDEVMKIFNIYVKDIENLEERLYERNVKNFMDEWFWLKKDLIRMNRILNQAIKTIDEFINANRTKEEFLHIGFSDISEHLNRTARGISINLEKLDTLYNFFDSVTNEKLNKNIYLLTILSAIFLPLNLLVGFFGMNTEGMIFSGNPEGTNIVLTTLILLTILFSIFLFKRFKS